MTLPMGRAMREVFGETVSELANQDQRIVMLDGDLGSSTRGEIFQRAHVDRYFQMGIAEQNMLGVAAGMASVGTETQGGASAGPQPQGAAGAVAAVRTGEPG